MKVNYDHIDLIERYLDDDLSQEELVMFSEKLNQDPQFNKLYFEMDHLLEGIRRSAKQSTIEEKLANLEMALPVKAKINTDESDTPVIQIWNFMLQYKTAVAASLTLLIVSVFVITNVNTTRSPEELFAEYSIPYEYISEAKRGISEKEKLEYALMEYKQGNYDEAIEIFEDIQINDENRIDIWLYGGNAYLKLNQVDKAIESFQKIIQANTGLQLEAKWYLSMCYLSIGDIAMAKPLLEEIKELERDYHEEAGEILSKMK